MPLLLVLAVVLGFLLFGNTHHNGLTPPPGVTNCAAGITPEAADQLSELDLYNARAWIMRECDDLPIPDITQATLDCEHRIADSYPDQIANQKTIYERQHAECPGELDTTPFEQSPYNWHHN